MSLRSNVWYLHSNEKSKLKVTSLLSKYVQSYKIKLIKKFANVLLIHKNLTYKIYYVAKYTVITFSCLFTNAVIIILEMSFLTGCMHLEAGGNENTETAIRNILILWAT